MDPIEAVLAGRPVRNVIAEADGEEPLLPDNAAEVPTGMEPVLPGSGGWNESNGVWTTFVLARRPDTYLRVRVFPSHRPDDLPAYVSVMAVKQRPDGGWLTIAAGRRGGVKATSPLMREIFRRLLHLSPEWSFEITMSSDEGERDATVSAYKSVLASRYEMGLMTPGGNSGYIFRPRAVPQ